MAIGDAKDVTTGKERAAGYRVVRVVSSEACPRNGNVHKPTPRYRWEVYRHGVGIGTGHGRASASELIAWDMLAHKAKREGT